MAIAPVALDVLERMIQRAETRSARRRRTAVALVDIHFVKESLAHLVHGDQVLVRAQAQRDAGGTAELESRVAGKHVGVGVARRQPWRDVESAGYPEILLHPRKVGTDAHAGNDAAGVLAVGPEQGPGARHECGLAERRVEHAAKLRIGAVTAAANKDRLLRADVDDRAALVDVAVLPVALQARLGRRVESWRIARPHSHDPAREWLLANDLGHSPIEHEADALLARAECQPARERGAVPDRVRPGPLGRAVHEARGEVARALAPDSSVLARDGSRL